MPTGLKNPPLEEAALDRSVFEVRLKRLKFKGRAYLLAVCR
jgi:hypothetical protein